MQRCQNELRLGYGISYGSPANSFMGLGEYLMDTSTESTAAQIASGLATRADNDPELPLISRSSLHMSNGQNSHHMILGFLDWAPTIGKV